MNATDKIYKEAADLAPDQQAEVLAFIEQVKHREPDPDTKAFTSFSIGGAMVGLEDEEDLYKATDIIERFS